MSDHAADSAPYLPLRTASVPAPEHPWRDDPPLPAAAPLGNRHGYLLDGKVKECTRDEMVCHLVKHPWTEGVCEPGATAPARPEDAPGLLDEYRAAVLRRARRDVAILCLVLLAALGWLAAQWDEVGMRSFPGLITVFAAAYLLMAVYDVHRVRQFKAADLVQARQAHRHWSWVRTRPAVFTWALLVPLGIVALVTLDTERAVQGAGLVKPAVWDGEVWRMLTGPMLHAGFYHAWLNLTALLALGRIVETHTSRFHLSAVFLLSVAGGSVLTLLISPRPSVGASGGVMGLVGFLWMLARLHPREVPDGFENRMKYVVGATAVLGILGLEFIDNWAHLGGLLAGAGLGWLTLRERTDRESLRLTAAGVLALMVLWAAMVGAVAATWSTPW
jgi:membrane associated rhomboid family serine protease